MVKSSIWGHRKGSSCKRKCRGSAQEVQRKCTGSAEEVQRKCTGSAQEVHRKCTGSSRTARVSVVFTQRDL